MNILTDELPATIEIDNTEYKIESDFRACLRIILAFEDNELTPQEKQVILLSILYPKLPHDVNQGLEKANWFLNGGKENNEDDNNNEMRLYSFNKDAQFIFSAFRQTHGIDLETASLHWWAFLALFMDLGSETTFCQLVSLRKRIKTGKATKEERDTAREMGDLFDIPDVDDRSLEEKEAEQDFLRKLEQARNNK